MGAKNSLSQVGSIHFFMLSMLLAAAVPQTSQAATFDCVDLIIRAGVLRSPPLNYMRITLKTGIVVLAQIGSSPDSILPAQVVVYVNGRAQVFQYNEISNIEILGPQHQWME